MIPHILTTAFFLLPGCMLLSPATGAWELEVDDAEHCELEMDLEQSGEDIDGDGELKCRIYFTIDGAAYYYDMEADDLDITGEFDDGDITLEFSFYDEPLEVYVDIEVEGELEEGEFEGELFIDGDRFGDISGDIE